MLITIMFSVIVVSSCSRVSDDAPLQATTTPLPLTTPSPQPTTTPQVESIKVPTLTLEQAQIQEGYFLKRGDCYYPMFNGNAAGDMHTYADSNSMYSYILWLESFGEILEYNQGTDKIVYCSNENSYIDVSKNSVYPVSFKGYTVPVHFELRSNDNGNKKLKVLSVVEQELSDKFPIDMVTDINGIPVTVNSMIGDGNNYHVKGSENEKVTMGGYVGTNYVETEMIANAKYYKADIEHKVDFVLNQTKSGYSEVVFNEMLPKGTYTFRFYKMSGDTRCDTIFLVK